jgi:hypothetical protein
LIWWRGAEIDLPDVQLDVAFQIKASTFRGETALAIEWMDFRETEMPSVEAAAPPLQIEVIDWRMKNLARVTLEEFQIAQQPSQGLATWADGGASAPFTVTRRYDLPQADILVIWSAPCGWRELVYAIERVRPTTIYLCATKPPTIVRSRSSSG